jgi:hypothetical protein
MKWFPFSLASILTGYAAVPSHRPTEATSSSSSAAHPDGSKPMGLADPTNDAKGVALLKPALDFPVNDNEIDSSCEAFKARKAKATAWCGSLTRDKDETVARQARRLLEPTKK